MDCARSQDPAKRLVWVILSSPADDRIEFAGLLCARDIWSLRRAYRAEGLLVLFVVCVLGLPTLHLLFHRADHSHRQGGLQRLAHGHPHGDAVDAEVAVQPRSAETSQWAETERSVPLDVVHLDGGLLHGAPLWINRFAAPARAVHAAAREHVWGVGTWLVVAWRRSALARAPPGSFVERSLIESERMLARHAAHARV